MGSCASEGTTKAAGDTRSSVLGCCICRMAHSGANAVPAFSTARVDGFVTPAGRLMAGRVQPLDANRPNLGRAVRSVEPAALLLGAQRRNRTGCRSPSSASERGFPTREGRQNRAANCGLKPALRLDVGYRGVTRQGRGAQDRLPHSADFRDTSEWNPTPKAPSPSGPRPSDGTGARRTGEGQPRAFFFSRVNTVHGNCATGRTNQDLV